jgi:hypothetical protein
MDAAVLSIMKHGLQIPTVHNAQATLKAHVAVEAGVSTWPANDKNNCKQGYDSTCLF